MCHGLLLYIVPYPTFQNKVLYGTWFVFKVKRESISKVCDLGRWSTRRQDGQTSYQFTY